MPNSLPTYLLFRLLLTSWYLSAGIVIRLPVLQVGLLKHFMAVSLRK